jgi:hypothetical protein
MRIDLDRVVTTALESYLQSEHAEQNGRRNEDRRRFGRVGAVAVGVVVGLAARKAYDRARALDLETVAGALEKRLKN